MWDWLRPYRLTPELLSEEELSALQREVMESPHLAPGALNGGQRGTYGYSIIFRRSSILHVCREMPGIRPYLEKTLDGRCNAFFINPLLISQGQKVAPHADRTLAELTTVPFPLKTSVLYLKVPQELKGGRLCFYLMRLPVAKVAPRENLLVEFPGAMRHSVEEVETCGKLRVSLVCEQYILKPRALESIPEYLLSTERESIP